MRVNQLSCRDPACCGEIVIDVGAQFGALVNVPDTEQNGKETKSAYVCVAEGGFKDGEIFTLALCITACTHTRRQTNKCLPPRLLV